MVYIRAKVCNELPGLLTYLFAQLVVDLVQQTGDLLEAGVNARLTLQEV